MSRSRQYRLTARPEGEIKDSDFELVMAQIPESADNEFVVQITHVSIDPAIRGWMSAARSYIPPVGIGEVMRALAVGRVIASQPPPATRRDRPRQHANASTRKRRKPDPSLSRFP